MKNLIGMFLKRLTGLAFMTMTGKVPFTCSDIGDYILHILHIATIRTYYTLQQFPTM